MEKHRETREPTEPQHIPPFFDVVSTTPGLVVANEWSPYLPDSKDLIADWRKPMNCGNFNVVTGKCGGKGK